jgi:hypothetical protein
MAHYSYLDSNNIVVTVIVGKDETELIDGLDPEIYYAQGTEFTVKRTSYNGKIRGKFASFGDSYDPNEDIFIEPRPFASWIRKGSYYFAPVDFPTPVEGKRFTWSEQAGNWIES